MKNLKFILIFLCFISTANAQFIYDGAATDSVMIRFDADTVIRYEPDTAINPVWQIGRTFKPFFTSDTLGAVAIMTDTLTPYPINANNFFIINIPYRPNTIVDFWHKYQTDSVADGGIVEFSLDRGINWQNIKGECNSDSNRTVTRSTLTAGFYSFNDTLPNGTPCFKGNSGGTVYSRFQFFYALPVRLSAASECEYRYGDTILVRFRFVSDSVADSLSGWMIDSIKVEYDIYSGFVYSTQLPAALHIYPNPSEDGTFHFPYLEDEERYTLSVFNITGERIAQLPYQQTLSLSNQSTGMYYYLVSDGYHCFAGKLMKS